MAEISLQQVTKVYPDGTQAVSAVDLEMPDGSFVVLVGPSGCGKTTLLRMIAGLETITDGTISIGDRVVNALPPKARDIAMVFQNYALYPHMSVRDNMAFSLKMRRTPRDQIDAKVGTAARSLGLHELLEKKPRHLSGGQRQRVAMGRAIVREPQAFLMDEPLSNLDAKLRIQMRGEIARLQASLGITTVYVTHDQTEAMTLGDLVAVMKLGVVQQVDRPQALYRTPANLFVAGFIGSPAMNLLHATIERDGDGLAVAFGGARLRLPATSASTLGDRAGQEVVLGIRPEDMEDPEFAAAPSPEAQIEAPVELREEMGAETYVYLSVDAAPVLTEDIRALAADTDAASLEDLEVQAAERKTRLVARLNPRTRVRVGDVARIGVDTRSLYFFDPATGGALGRDRLAA